MNRSLVWKLLAWGLTLIIGPPVLFAVAIGVAWAWGGESRAAAAGMVLAIGGGIPAMVLMMLGAILTTTGGILAWARRGKKPTL